MKTLIEKKSENLLNITAKDECILLLKIKNKKYIDLLEVFNINKINSLFNKEINLLQFPLLVNTNNLENNLNSLKDKKLDYVLNSLNKMFQTLHIDEKIINFVSKDEQNNIKWLLNKILEFANLMNNNLDTLYKIHKQARKEINKKGIETLYIARYFLYYKTKDEFYIRAPLIFLPVNIDLQKNQIISNSEWQINEKLLIFLSKNSEKNIDFNNSYTIQELLNLINNLTESDFNISEPCLFENYTKLEFIDYIENNNYSIKDQTVLGIFGINDAILYREINDLKKLDQNFDPFQNEEINFISHDDLIEQETNSKSLLLLDKNSDIYQRYSIRSSMNQDTIIFGPPGTGKSQTISNLIINLLFNDKTALIVSEKATALNVILKRLKNLSIFFLYITHYDDKSTFYEIFKKLKNVLQNDWFYENFNFDKEKEKEKLIVNELNSKQFDIDLKGYFIRSQQIINKFNYDIDELKIYFKLVQELGSDKYNLIKDNKFIADFYNDLKAELEKYNIDPIAFFNKSESFLKENGDIKTKEYELNTSFMKSLLKIIPDLLNPNNEENNKYVISEIQKLIDNKLIDLNDIDFIKNNFFELKEIIVEVKGYWPLINKKLKDKPFSEIEKFCANISNISDEKTLAYKYEKFLNDENYNDELKGIKKVIYKNKGINHEDMKYIYFVKNNINMLSNNIAIFIIYENILFNNSAWFFYVNELADPIFIFYFTNKIYLFPIDYLNFFSKNEISFTNIQDFIEINKYKEKIKNYNELNNFDELNNIYYKDSLEYEILTKNVSELLFKLLITRLRIKLANLTNDEKKEMQTILATGSLTKRPDIYRFLNEHQKLLKEIFPIWLGAPENIARNLYLNKDYFDYGIFDEASQVYLEKIYSIAYRTKTKIVAGDDKQIQPTTFFNTIEEYDPDENYEFDYTTDAAESLLEKAKSLSWNEFMLKNHYRSDNEKLIEFSNKEFYNNELECVTYNFENIKSPFKMFQTNGIFLKDGTNPIEAEKVIEILQQYHDKFDDIIVITSNVQQMNLIDKLINNDSELSKLDENKINVTNLENIQGEEADLVIFDITYAKRENTDLLSSNFGTLNLSNGKFRLNVAITRAKKQMFIVKSFNSSEIRNESKNPNITIFKKYLNFIEENTNETNLKDTNNNEEFIKNTSYYEYNDFFLPLLDKIRGNYKILINYKIGNKNIDYAFYDTNKNQIILLIIIDGFKEEKELSRWIQKIDFQRYLEKRGYRTYRINIFEWILKYEIIIKNISNILSIKGE